MPSIQGRLVFAASLVLLVFLGLGALALDRAYRDSVEQALHNELMGQVYALLGAAQTDAAGRMRLPDQLPDPRLVSPDSGRYAAVRGEDGRYQWQTPSALGRQLPQPESLAPGADRFTRNDGVDPHYRLTYRLLWEDDQGKELSYTVLVVEHAADLDSRVAAFRRTILIWLGGAALVLLLVQGGVLRWALRPLRQVAEDLREIEGGQRNQLQGSYPRELQKLTAGINNLIRHSSASRDRYRDSLGDLAHSLKTPLALLQGAAEGRDNAALRLAVREQVPHMNSIVQYQLKAAAAAGQVDLAHSATTLLPLLEKLVRTLDKVYAEKAIDCELTVDPSLKVPMEEGDLLECLGNLLDNAYKYGRQRIAVKAGVSPDGAVTWLEIADDGPGIPAADWPRLLRRGERADQRLPGQGIGLSVVHRIATLYGGSLQLDSSTLGGVCIRFELPSA